MKKTITLNLDHFLAQIRYASALFGRDKTLTGASGRFTTFFGADNQSATFESIFVCTPLLSQKIAQVFAEKSPFYLHEMAVTCARGEDVFNIEIFPLMSADEEFDGVVLNLFESHGHSFFSEQKRRAGALNQMNLIAGGLAHEIRNPLSGLKGAAELIPVDISNAERLKEYARIIIKESDRIDRLVGELLDFTKPKTLQHVPLNINKVLYEALQVLRYGDTRGVVFKENFDPSLPEISGDADALKQVFINLLKNAIEAVAANGNVNIKSQIVTDFVLKTASKKRQIVCLQIEDDGCGMNEEELKNIFTPYYTTKEKGTGLGLVIVNQLVELHGGSLTIKSKIGEGTVFSVFLPV